MKKAVYPGSFDPLTMGHMWVIDQGSKLFDELIISVGRNPQKTYTFTAEERMEMIKESTSDYKNIRVEMFGNKLLFPYVKSVGATHVLRGMRDDSDFKAEYRDTQISRKQFGMDIVPIFLIPPEDFIYTSSSFVKGIIGFENWEDVIRKYVPQPVYNEILRKFENARTKPLD